MKNRLSVGSTHHLVAIRLLISLLLLLLARVAFIVANKNLLDPALGFQEGFWLVIIGLRFDFSALMMINSLWIALAALPFPIRKRRYFKLLTDWLYYLPNITALTINLVDVAYYPFTLRRTNADVINLIMKNQGLPPGLITSFIHDYWYLVAILAIILVFFVVVIRKIKVESKLTFHQKGAFVVWNLPAYLIWMALVVIGIRGGFQLKPISLVNAASLTTPEKAAAVLNTPFVVVKTIKTKTLPDKSYMTAKEAQALFNPRQQVVADSLSGLYKGFNVMVIVMESFSLEHTGASGLQSYTPFLDSLGKQGVLIKSYANGKRSIEAIPAILASLPTWMDFDYISSPYASNSINSLASLLGDKGYTSRFFHGGNNGTMSFDAFCRLAGFDRYDGRTEYNNDADFDGKWGIFDEPFFSYTANQLNLTQQPFVAGLFSLSSHHPYTIPEKYKGKFPTGKLPIQQAVAYADYSLSEFFKKIEQAPWYRRTLFVVTADHTSESAGGYYETQAGQYTIPLLFFTPGGLPRPDTVTLAQQTDIMPTLLYLLGFDKPFTAFGSNIYDPSKPRFALNYSAGTYQFFFGDYVLHFNGDRITACYNLVADPLQTKNLNHAPNQDTQKGEQLLKALIQQYNNRMNTNQLTTP